MFAKLIYTILNIILIINGAQMTKCLDGNTGLDLFETSSQPTDILLQKVSPEPLNQAYYSLIAPGLLKSNRKYTVVISLHNAKKTCSVSISITATAFNASQTVSLQPYKSKIVDFYIPKLSYGNYMLVAEGVEGCSFKQEKRLLAEVESGPKIYIQTDKAVYKSQDIIQFRVLFLDEHTRPLSIDEPVHIEILDAKDNIVKIFKDVQFTKGMYTNRFQLSDRPIMGTWSIRVSVSGVYAYSKSKSLEVKNYILPKFSVHIKTPKHVVTSDSFMKAFVYGKYTFGKYVQGIATVQLWNAFNKKMWQEKKINVSTLAGVEFSLANIEQFTKEDSFNLVVTLQENFTGITQKESQQIMLHNQRYNIYADDEDFEFRGFEPYRLNVHVKYWNGAPVLDGATAVTLSHGDKSYEAYIGDNGVVKFEFESQADSGYLLYFKDSFFHIPNLFQSAKESNSSVYFCKLKLVGERLRLGAPVKISVSSSEDIPHLVYTIVGHSNIIRMQHIKLPPQQKSYTIHIKPTIEMIPVSYVHVHYSYNGEFHHDEMELVFPKEFENKISLTAPKETKPGEEVILEINAQPQSIVGILAVDLGVHLLDPSYDLQRDYILNELAEDKSYIYSEYITEGEFLFSGLIILTNIKQELKGIRPKKPIREADIGPLSYRTQFPEVWIFENIEVNSTNTEIIFQLPDSITTWRITAFSLNDKTGLGIVNGPTDVTAIKPFFISLNLPYSVKWGEIVSIPILVFNYDSQSLDSTIIMYNDEQEFEFMESSGEDEAVKSENQKTKMVKSVIQSNGGDVFSFYIKPLKVGQISLRIAASNKLHTDAVHQQLKVESEGLRKNINQAVYLNSSNESSGSLPVKTPSNVDAATNEIFLSVGGDYIVPVLDNLQNLVERPTGCGEQNMVHFAPNILILQYLKASNAYAKEKELVATIKSYIDIGYQQQVSFRHDNGGYSVFGQSEDEEASTWLTAYAVRFFIKATKFSVIERRIIDSGLDYLSKAQLNDGSFPYTGYLFEPAQQNQYGLTAFILATFLEDRMYARRYQEIIDKGLQFLTKNLDSIEDAYALSIVAFVLQMAKNSSANKVLEKLQRYRRQENGLVWWSRKDNLSENNVEITSYVLMALIDTTTTNELMPILKWLVGQRNAKGGFLSTHDTVVGLQALVKFNQQLAEGKNATLEIKYTAKDQQGAEVEKGEFKVQPGNFRITQKQKLPQTTHNVSFETSGTGSALLQLEHSYKLLDAATEISPMISNIPKLRKKYELSNNTIDVVKYFIIEPKVNILKNHDLDLDICFVYKNKTNMVIMEIDLPSGYSTDDETLADVQNNEVVQRIASQNHFTNIIVYLHKLPIDAENCLNILAYQTSEVLQRKPTAIVMYDYYKAQLYNSIYYSI